MAGNSTKVFNFFRDGTNIKAVLVEEAPDKEGSCYLCKSPLRSSPFYTTEPWIFDVHSRCAENCRLIPGQEKSYSPAPGNHHPGQQQPNVNAYGSVSHVQPKSFSFHPPPYYPQPPKPYPNPYYSQPPNPPNPYPYPQPPNPPNPYPYPYYPHPPNPPNPYPYPYYPQPPNPPNPYPYPYYPQPPNPVSGTSSAASSAVSDFLQALFGNILQIGLPFGNN